MQNLLKNFTTQGAKGSLLLSFEGIEGSGKSTQIKNIEAYYKERGKEVFYFREPGGTKFGEKLREAILNSDAPLAPIAEANLFASARAQLLFQEIVPKLEQENTVVILDRYIDSSIAYQASARGLGLETILQLHQHPPLNTMPHCTFYLSIDLETSFERQQKRGNEKDYFEKENTDFYQKLIEGYELASETFHHRIVKIDGSKSPDEVFAQIKFKLEELN
jgi:dTMP kinase